MSIRIDPDRLLTDLETLRSFGRKGTGVIRPAFSDADIAARIWLSERFADAGLVSHLDCFGNLFGLPTGDHPCFLVGSHSDSQPEGGWLDGSYGVVAGLELARASRENGGPEVAVVSFQDEEGRFAPLGGSGFWVNQTLPEQVDDLRDVDGVTLAQARAAMAGLQISPPVDPGRFRAFIELHIEQGPVLDGAGEQLGVVESIVGIRSERFVFTGQQNHAGTTPMHLRRDAFQGLVAFTTLANHKLDAVIDSRTVWTIGRVALHPNAASIVPGRVDFTVQWRDGDEERLEVMTEIFRGVATNVAAERGLGFSRSEFVRIPPHRCDPGLVAALSDAAELVAPGRWRRMPSGALHDAANLARRMPVAMLFVPSIKGISHSFDEDTDRHYLVRGVEALARAVAYVASLERGATGNGGPHFSG